MIEGRRVCVLALMCRSEHNSGKSALACILLLREQLSCFCCFPVDSRLASPASTSQLTLGVPGWQTHVPRTTFLLGSLGSKLSGHQA